MKATYGKTTSLAPASAASAVRVSSFFKLKSRSNAIGAACTAATLSVFALIIWAILSALVRIQYNLKGTGGNVHEI